MNRKYIGIIAIAAGLLLLAGIVYIIFFHKFEQPEEEQAATVEEKQILPAPTAGEQLSLPPEQPAAINIEKPKLSEIDVIKDDLKRMAFSFAERLGSFSNHSNYGNINDLKLFMSSKMKDWADKYVEEAIARGGDSTIYYGITTKAIAAEIRQFDNDEGRAEIFVKTKRREATGATGNAASFYQDVLIAFVKESGAWKVNSAYWQGK